jgi:hypothetical protein
MPSNRFLNAATAAAMQILTGVVPPYSAILRKSISHGGRCCADLLQGFCSRHQSEYRATENNCLRAEALIMERAEMIAGQIFAAISIGIEWHAARAILSGYSRTG